MITVQRIAKRFGPHRAVDDVSFAVAAGETLVLLGASGCGKTTTLKMLNRLLEADSGEILIGGTNIRQMAPEELRRGIGYVIQQGGLFPHYTVAENIAVVPRLLKWSEPRVHERVGYLLEVVGLPPGAFAQKYPHQLSGGQGQRVGLARALAAHPPIILMDEPFGALDPLTRHRIRQEFRQLEELRQKTIVLVTHDVTEAVLLADRIALMDAGRILQLGTPRALLLQPANDLVRQFFDHQRLPLEWMVQPLGTMLEGVLREVGEAGERANAPVFGAERSLWEVLETLRARSERADMIGIRTETGIRYVAWPDLLARALAKGP